MNFITYILPVKPGGQAQGGILRRSMMFALGNDSPVRMWEIIPLIVERRFLAQVITSDFCCFSQRALHGVHSPYSPRCVVR